jgi:hypothetical protein
MRENINIFRKMFDSYGCIKVLNKYLGIGGSFNSLLFIEEFGYQLRHKYALLPPYI